MQKIDLQQIQQRLDANLPQPNESQPDTQRFTASNLPPKHPLWTLWSRFSEVYGHQWSSQQGEEPNDTWIRGLDGITNEQFGAGLRALINRSETWPPNLVEFRQLCTGYDPRSWERQAHRIVNPSSMLENKTAKERRIETGKAEIRKIREELGL